MTKLFTLLHSGECLFQYQETAAETQWKKSSGPERLIWHYSRWLLIKDFDFEQVPAEELYLLCRVCRL